MRSLYNDNQIVLSRKNHDSFTSQMCKHGYLGYGQDKVRQTILQHESIFKNQLRELHRLYGRQQELMNEIKTRELSRDKSQSSNFFAPVPREDGKRRWNLLQYPPSVQLMSGGDSKSLPVLPPTLVATSLMNHRTYGLGLQAADMQERLSSDRDTKLSLSTVQTSFDLNFRRTNHQGEVSANSDSNCNPVVKDFFQNSPKERSKKELASVSQRKRKLFGVEIYEANDDTLPSSSQKKTTLHQENDGVVSIESSSWMSSSCIKYLKPSDNLPWFLKNSQVSVDPPTPIKEKKSSYFMNLDSLQNCSDNFFKKADRKDRTNEINDGSSTSPKKILGFPLSDRKVETDIRHSIDLNLTLDEDAQSAPSLPADIVKITTTEIDLEASAVIESEAGVIENPVDNDECDKIAAEAILAISLSEQETSMDNDGCLKWLAEIIASQCDEQESILGGMDYFEFMTLKLEETKEEDLYHHHLPVLSNTNPSGNDDDDEDARNVRLSKRSRRGRGRQRKDFQRDILPGLVTLSRLEVTEDLQTFEELGFSQRSSMRNGRGKKRLGGSNTSPNRKTLSSKQSEKLVCELGERSLTGWGKRTRRLPRQRCNTSLISFLIKC